MVDKKFAIAVLIIVVLAVALLYMTVINPRIQGYIISKQAQAQEGVVQAILQIVDQQGYVALGDGENSVVLVRYQPPEAQAQAQEQSEDQNQVELVDQLTGS